MAIKKLLVAAGAVFVLVLGAVAIQAVAHQRGVEQGQAAVTQADGYSADNTPWTR